jgi:hypothetical protein
VRPGCDEWIGGGGGLTERDDVAHLERVALDAVEDVDLLQHELDRILLELAVIVFYHRTHEIPLVLLSEPNMRRAMV